MGLPIARNTGAQLGGSIQNGQISVGVSASNYGANAPGGLTYYNSITPPVNGLTIVSQSTIPPNWVINDLSNSTEVLNVINGLPDRVGQIRFTDTSSALNYITGSTGYVALNRYNSTIPEYLFGANLFAHHDASLPTSSVDLINFNTVDTTGTTSISRLYDVSGNGRHAFMTTKANQPTIGTFNGKNTAQSLSGGKGLQINGLASNPSTYYIVYKYGGGGEGVFSCGRGSETDGFALQNTLLLGYTTQFSGAPYFSQIRCNFGSPSANNQFQILVLNCFSTYTDFYLTINNGTIQKPSTTLTQGYFGPTNLNYKINAGFQTGYFCRNLGDRIDTFATGEIAEGIFINRTSTASEIITMQNYLYSKWFNS
jgi:hypothetical protein